MWDYYSSNFVKYTSVIGVFLCTFVIVHWLIDVLLPRKRLPPGPLPLPVVGNLPTFGRRIDESLCELGKKYGDVFTVYFGGVPAIILNSYGTIKDAFSRQGGNFTGRPNYIMFELTSNKRGVILSDGEVWKLHRKLVINLLRDYGFGKASMEDKICEEAGMLVAEVKKCAGGPFNFHTYIGKSIANVICSVTYGERFDYNDKTFQDLIKIFDDSVKLVGAGAIVNFFPWLSYLPGDFFKLNLIQEMDAFCTNFNGQIVDRRLKNFDPDKIDSFIDSYIDALHKEGEYPETSPAVRTQMCRVINDFFGAGSETTTTTLRWAVLYLLHYPEYQSKIQTEIDDVIGKDGVPSMRDMRSMPFTEAFLCETLRLGNITPLGLMHSTTKDVHFHGYDIPADTLVFANMTSVLMDAQTFEEPRNFNPSRFLNEDGKVVKPESFIPFSIGKRVCIGESLARMELFLFFTILLQTFTFKLPAGHALPSRDGILGLTLAPVDHEVCVESRT